MDKPNQTINRIVPHKRGFALILTLSVLAIVIALTAVLMTYLDDARKESDHTKALIQGNLFYADIEKTFKRFKNRKTLYSVLYLTPLPLTSQDGKFSIMLTCRPSANGANINWLALGNDQKMRSQYDAAQSIFETIAQTYALEDPSRLEELLLEEIGGKEKYVRREQSRLVQKNGIISYEQFMTILTKYQFEADDSKASHIPWEKFFVFNKVEKNPNENLIDGEYMSVELIAMLSGIDLATVKEGWIEGEVKLQSFIRENGGAYDKKLFSKAFLAQTVCEAQYKYGDEMYRFRFEDSKGEVKNFEFYGKQ